MSGTGGAPARPATDPVPAVVDPAPPVEDPGAALAGRAPTVGAPTARVANSDSNMIGTPKTAAPAGGPARPGRRREAGPGAGATPLPHPSGNCLHGDTMAHPGHPPPGRPDGGLHCWRGSDLVTLVGAGTEVPVR